jgi:hypothetical protein
MGISYENFHLDAATIIEPHNLLWKHLMLPQREAKVLT